MSVRSNFATYDFDAIPAEYVLSSTSTQYDADGRAIVQIDENGLRSETTYDIRGNVVQTRRESRSETGATQWLVTRTVYDAGGRAVVSTGQYLEGTTAPISGSRTTYDLAGRVTKSEQLRGVVINLTGTGAIREATLASAGAVISSSTSEFDSSGRAVKSIDQYGLESRTLYGKFGEILESRRQSYSESGAIVWLVSRTVYDSFGRSILSTEQYQEGTTAPIFASTTQYDSFGRSFRTARVKGVQVSITGTTGDGFTSSITSPGVEISSSETIYDSKGRAA